jgi:hypothetical protein
MEGFLKLHKVSEADRSRLAKSLLASAKKYDLNPKLLASVMIVESRGNPFAVSGQNAVGLMQIHLPTWGETADREDINLFKIEDNIDFGARILQGYVRRFGVWDGVKTLQRLHCRRPHLGRVGSTVSVEGSGSRWFSGECTGQGASSLRSWEKRLSPGGVTQCWRLTGPSVRGYIRGSRFEDWCFGIPPELSLC